jgi:hypothetical protein
MNVNQRTHDKYANGCSFSKKLTWMDANINEIIWMMMRLYMFGNVKMNNGVWLWMNEYVSNQHLVYLEESMDWGE